MRRRARCDACDARASIGVARAVTSVDGRVRWCAVVGAPLVLVVLKQSAIEFGTHSRVKRSERVRARAHAGHYSPRSSVCACALSK